MAKNQLIIGLGGVGGQSIAAFRKAVKTHEADREVLTGEKGCHFEYLYIDSNDDILNSDIWDVYGQSVRLERADYVMLKEAGTTSSIKEISQYKNIAPWIGRLADHLAKRNGKVNLDDGSLDAELMGLKGAGQLRRYGRVLFALHAPKIRDNIQSKIEKLMKDSDSSQIDVRIFCTLGGGTGSGSIIDMITLIKSIAKANGHEYNTLVYTFVAGSGRYTQNAGLFYENEYAALRDLNALMVGKYLPDVAELFGGPVDAREIVTGNPPILKIYISTEYNTAGTPSLGNQINFMAKSCYDEIAYSMFYTKGDAIKALTGEDLYPANPGEPSKDNLLRSYRFAALGSKRWCVPTEEITELLKYDYELRVLDSWLKGAPLPSDMPPRNTNDTGDVFSPKSSKTWKAIEDFCEKERDTLRNIYEEINVKGKRGADTLRLLDDQSEKSAEKITQEMLSRLDVRHAIQNCADEDTTNMLTTLKDKIDHLFRWGGVDAWGIVNIQTYLENFARRIELWDQELIEPMTEQQVEGKRKDISGTMRKREIEWEKIGILTIHLTGKDERMINDQYEDCTQRIDLALRPFRRRSIQILMEKARNKVAELAAHVETASSEIRNACSEIRGKIDKRMSDLSINTDTEDSMSDQFEFDLGNLQRLRDAIKHLDDEHASEMIRTYSPAWDRIVGSFDKYEVNHIKTIRGTLYGAFEESSKRLHDSAVKRGTKEGPLRDVITTSIFDYLTNQLAGKDAGPDYENWEKALGKKIANFVGKLRCSTNIRGNGLTSPQVSPCKAIAFGFPKNANPPPGFVKWLKEKLKKALSTDFLPSGSRMDFYEHCTSTEIRVLYMPYWFPARFSPVVPDIYNHYRETAKSSDERVSIYFANIDDRDTGLSSRVRPALTTDGDPDKDTARRVDLARKLYLKHSEQRQPIVKLDNIGGIKIIKSMDADGIAEYGHETYSPEEKAYPSDRFKRELNGAIDMALKQMDEGERRAVFKQYTEALQKLEKEGMDADRDELAIEAREARNSARDLLGLND